MDFMDWTDCSYQSGTDLIPTLTCLPPLIATIVTWLLIFVGAFALFMIIYSGFKFMTSSGDPKALDSAKKTLTYAVLGMVLVLLSFFIIGFISTVSGVKNNCITLFGFSNCSDATPNP